MREVEVRVPASCGEFWQGMVDGRLFHVACPIGLAGTVRVERVAPPGVRRRLRPPSLDFSDSHWKAHRAAQLAADGDDSMAFQLHFGDEIPMGKGLASSTADVIGAIAGVRLLCGLEVSEASVARLACQVEPTQGTFLKGLAAFCHTTGDLGEVLSAAPPPLSVIAIDTGGTVDTLEYNRRNLRPHYEKQASAYRDSWELIREAFRRGDGRLLAQAATASARLQQGLLPKTGLEELEKWALRAGAYGLCVAHSGTVIGILGPAHPDWHPKISRACRLKDLRVLYSGPVVSGGWEIFSGPHSPSLIPRESDSRRQPAAA